MHKINIWDEDLCCELLFCETQLNSSSSFITCRGKNVTLRSSNHHRWKCLGRNHNTWAHNATFSLLHVCPKIKMNQGLLTRPSCMSWPSSLWCAHDCLLNTSVSCSQISIHSSAGKAVVWWGQRLLLSIPAWLQSPMPPEMLRPYVHPLYAGTLETTHNTCNNGLTIALTGSSSVFYRWCGQHPIKWAVLFTRVTTWTFGVQCGSGQRI